MPYNIYLADRVRTVLAEQTEAVEKEMFSGVCFMVNDKMCICVSREELLCRIGEKAVAKAVEDCNCRQMINNGRVSKDYIFVAPEAFETPARLAYWIKLCLAFNPFTKASKKKK